MYTSLQTPHRHGKCHANHTQHAGYMQEGSLSPDRQILPVFTLARRCYWPKTGPAAALLLAGIARHRQETRRTTPLDIIIILVGNDAFARIERTQRGGKNETPPSQVGA